LQTSPPILFRLFSILSAIRSCSLFWLASSLWRLFRARRAADAQLQEKIMRDFIADRAKTQGQDHP
jgi:hypothetical protein